MIIDLSRPVDFNKNDPFFMRVKIKHKLDSALAGAAAGAAISEHAQGLHGLGG